MGSQNPTQFRISSRSAAVRAKREYYFDRDKANHVIEFFETWLCHSKGKFAGKPFTLLNWEREALANLFGWCRCDTGKRRYRVGYISTPKKNGKTTLLAGIALYLLLMDDEPGSEVYGAAFDREQGSMVYREAAAMVRASPRLRQFLEIVDTRKTIAYKDRSSFYRVLTRESAAAEGLNIHGLLFDELHTQRDRKLWDALRYGGASREQPMLLSTTTAGFARNTICWEQYQYAKAVAADPSIDPTFFSCIHEAPEEADWKDPAVWEAANPSWGETFDPEAFRADFREAEQSTAKENSFRRYRLNQWTHQDVKWLRMTAWDACASGPPGPLAGRECWCALDLASTGDTSAFLAVFPAPDGTIDVVSKFWIPGENAIERESKDRVPYVQWANDPSTGLTMCDGNVTDFDVIRRDVLNFSKAHNVKRIALDMWNATQLSLQLQGDGLDVVAFRPSFGAMSSPSKMLETLVLSGRLRHGGNPILSWMAGNVSVRTNADGAIRPVKPQKGSVERIDGIVALVMALGVYESQKPVEEKPKPSIIIL